MAIELKIILAVSWILLTLLNVAVGLQMLNEPSNIQVVCGIGILLMEFLLNSLIIRKFIIPKIKEKLSEEN